MELKRIFDLVERWEQHFPTQRAFVRVGAEGEMTALTGAELAGQVQQLSLALVQLGVKAGDCVLIMSANRPEVNLLDLAVSRCGAVPVLLYPSTLEKDVDYICRHTQAPVVFVETQEHYQFVVNVAHNSDFIRNIYSFERLKSAHHWTAMLDLAKTTGPKEATTLVARMAAVQTNDLFSIIYTSGTTGLPKGVMLSHGNILSNMASAQEMFHVVPGECALGILPLAHILARMTNYWFQYNGVAVYYPYEQATIARDLRLVRPQALIVVPAVLERFYARLQEGGLAQKGFKRKVFFWALGVANRFRPQGRGPLYALQLKYANKLVLHKIQDALGGRVRVAISGGAAIEGHLMRLFNAAGILLLEGYGLSETSPVVCVPEEDVRKLRIGSVGRPLKGVSVRLAPDNEVLVQGPNVMLGYYKDPERTAEVLRDGWLYTGDLGSLDADGYLTITDRKKEMLKLSNGQYVAPQRIENALKSSLLVDRAMAVGDNKDHIAAIISPNFSYLETWAAQNRLSYRSRQELVSLSFVRMRFKSEIGRINELLSDDMQVRDFEMVADTWTVESGELSPTLKLKRRFVLEKYSVQANMLYAENRVPEF